jgi:cytochrome c biogenesis protein CcdA
VGLRTSNTTSLATILIVLFFLGFVAGQFGGVILLFVSLFAFIAFGIGVYFLPTFIAVNREHPDRYAIFIINLFFGWTFLGWIACLAWSVMDRRR